MNTGVYQILNKVNGYLYIGSSALSFNKRFASHRHALSKNKHYNRKLQNSYNKYGKDAFEFSILQYCPPELCIKKEQWFIDVAKTYFNISPIAGNVLGIKHTEAQKEANRQRGLGRKLSEETRRKISLANKGKNGRIGLKLSDEHKAKMSEARKGKKLDEATKNKISKALKGGKGTMLGKNHKEESKNKIKNSNYKFIYKILTPNGDIIETKSVKEFSRNNNLNNTSLMNTITKCNKKGEFIYKCKGYKIISKEQV
jgi:group I intron endonuclease